MLTHSLGNTVFYILDSTGPIANEFIDIKEIFYAKKYANVKAARCIAILKLRRLFSYFPQIYEQEKSSTDRTSGQNFQCVDRGKWFFWIEMLY